MRPALDPYVLPRIPRGVVRERLDRLKASLRSYKPGVFALVGDAGCGKSTALGEICDELGADAGWVALILCGDLDFPKSLPAELGTAFGQAAGASLAIDEVARRLTRVLGPGVLLVDTLDLVLSPALVPSLHHVLADVLDAGATVVVTCRKDEYESLLEPPRSRLPGIAARLDRWHIADFAPDEMEAAARAFAARWHPADGGSAFAGALARLSADGTPLGDIARNPLLLSLLCDLFGREEGHVPPDLTVKPISMPAW